MHGEHVGLLEAARIDALVRLDRRQRGEPVAIDRGALEIERGRRLIHLRRHFLFHRLAAAGEEFVGLAHQFAIAGEIDLLRARRRAALDLIEQARPRARLEKQIRARAQQEGALQRVDGAVDRAGRGERPVIMARPRARAAMLEDLRRPVIRRDQDVGKRLVVAQQHVEARAQPLDQIGFEQQRFGLGLGGDELHRRRRRDHAHDAAVVAGRPRIGGDPLLDVLRLADVEHVALGVDHAIDAGRRRRVLDRARDRGAAGGERAGRASVRLQLGQCLLVVLLAEFARRVDVFGRAVHGIRAVDIGNRRLAKVRFTRKCAHSATWRASRPWTRAAQWGLFPSLQRPDRV